MISSIGTCCMPAGRISAKNAGAAVDTKLKQLHCRVCGKSYTEQDAPLWCRFHEGHWEGAGRGGRPAS